jgi:hypothetical protein
MSELETDPEVNYDLSFLRKPKWIALFFIFFLFVTIYNFPLGKKLDNLVYSSLQISSVCKLQISDYEVNVFPLPHVLVKDLNVPGVCMGRGKPDISLPDVRAYFRGPSFSPLGILFKVESEFESVPLEVFITAGMSKVTIVLKESLIPLEKLRTLLPSVKLAGQVKTDLYVELIGMKLQGLNIKLQSKTFLIPAQNIEGYKIDTLNIQDLLLIAATDNNSVLKISKFVLGSEKSPVRSSFKGTIKMSPSNFVNSILDIKGELALSDELNDSIGFILSKFDKKDNFYQIQVSGPLSNPKTGSKR